MQVSGLRVGQVSSVSLDGPRVLVEFNVDKNIRLGDRTEAAIKTKTLLGAKIVEVAPARRRATVGTHPPRAHHARPTNCPTRSAI